MSEWQNESWPINFQMQSDLCKKKFNSTENVKKKKKHLSTPPHRGRLCKIAQEGTARF